MTGSTKMTLFFYQFYQFEEITEILNSIVERFIGWETINHYFNRSNIRSPLPSWMILDYEYFDVDYYRKIIGMAEKIYNELDVKNDINKEEYRLIWLWLHPESECKKAKTCQQEKL
jgi:hypothetical protein